MRSRLAILLIVLAFLTLAPAVSGQLDVKPTSLVYIQVEPQGLGEVGYYPSAEPAREWPRATTPIGGFFTMAFPQDTYLYLEARPYGCSELERWEVTPEDVEKTYYGGAQNRLIIILSEEYVTVKAVFKKIPEDRCPYIPIWRSIRVRKDDLYTGLIVFAAVGSITAVTYRIKKARDRRRMEEERKRFEVEMIRGKLLERTIDWMRPVMITPWQVILWTSLKWPSLEEASLEDLKASLLDDERLRSLRLSQTSGMASIAHCYISHASDMYVGNIPLLGLKTYLALFNLAPSTDEITKMYISSIDPRRIPVLWHDLDGERALKQILGLIRENINLQRRGLRKVLYLIQTDPEYANRIRNPPEYYEAILAFIEEWTREKLGVIFRGIRVRPQMKEIDAYNVERPVHPPVQKLGKAYKEAAKQEDTKLPDTPPPEWLIKALEEAKREEEAIKEEVGKAEEMERARRIEEEIRIAEKNVEEVRQVPTPSRKPPAVSFEIPVKWDELPRQLQKQIEDLGLAYEEVASIALRTMGKGEREVYREVNRLVIEKYPGMDENSIVSTLLTVVNIVSWLQNIMEDGGVRPGLLERPVEAPERSGETPAEPAETAEPGNVGEFGRAGEHVEVMETEKGKPEVVDVLEAGGVKTSRGEIPFERASQGKIMYKGVEVDSVSHLRTGGLAPPRHLVLIDSPLPLDWIPTPVMADIFYRTFEQRPICVEGGKHYGRDVLAEVFEKVKRMVFTSDATPVLVLGRPGLIFARKKGERIYLEKKGTIYIDRVKQLMRRLVKEDILRFAVAMPFQVYVQYCMDDPLLKMFRKHVYIVDLEGAIGKLKGKVSEGAVPYLALISSLSPRLLSELSEGKRAPTWEPQEYEKTSEGKALAWAVKTIYSKGGPLTIEEIAKAGYKEYLESFKVLGMIED